MVKDMSSRMERYNYLNEEENNSPSRVSKNSVLYDEVKASELTRVNNNSNVKIIEQTGKTIDLEKIKKYIKDNSDTNKARRKVISLPEEDNSTPVKVEENKVYDINSVLEKARENRSIEYSSERYRQVRSNEYDILNKIKMYEEPDSEEEATDDLNTDERTIVDLINTVTVHKGDVNLLEELMAGGETTGPISEEQSKNDITNEISEYIENKKSVVLDKDSLVEDKTEELVNLKEKIDEMDKSFYTNSMTFNKDDFEGFDELEKSVKKSSIFKTLLIIILIISIIASLVIIGNYVFELGLF